MNDNACAHSLTAVRDEPEATAPSGDPRPSSDDNSPPGRGGGGGGGEGGRLDQAAPDLPIGPARSNAGSDRPGADPHAAATRPAGAATRSAGAAVRSAGAATCPAGAAVRSAGAATRSAGAATCPAGAATRSAGAANRRWSSTGWRRAAFVPAFVPAIVVPAIVVLVGYVLVVVAPAPALALGFALVGAAMGGAGRVWLGRLREPVVCRAPWCEVAGAVLSGVVGWLGAAGLLAWWWLPVPLVLGWFAVPLAAADVIRRRLPNALTLATLPALLLVTVPYEPAPLAGAAVFGAAHAAVRLLAPRSLGGGDVKLAAALGVVLGALGWADLALAAFLAALITLSIALVARRRTAPHGPGLLAATWLLAALTPLAGLPYRG